VTRSTPLFVLSLLLAAAAVAVTFSRSTLADGASPHRIAVIYVTGHGPQAKAWYDGAPPQGIPVQAALDTYAKDGFHTVAVQNASFVGSSNPSANPMPSTGGIDGTFDTRMVLVLER